MPKGWTKPVRAENSCLVSRAMSTAIPIFPEKVEWWRGLDSNQRTLARADLQSAAFNHSATSPGAGRRAMWRRRPLRRVSTRSQDAVAMLARSAKCPRRDATSPVVALCHPTGMPRRAGAGEGNRTLVVSLEGFCSTIELHPPGLVADPMPLAAPRRQPSRRGLDACASPCPTTQFA